MAWGTGATEDELKRIAAVRDYLSEQFLGFSIRDSYDPARLAHVFHIELDVPPTTYTAVISTEFLQDHSPEISRTILASWEVLDRLRAAQGAELLIMSWGIQTPGGQG